ncbi:PAS domain S-box/diguanylate cyclase (GGDEF) domain-containing protein [Burkholderiales bacterium JOSHI_001]|nr:PAS domain S-box/diguanylate cyclase (GGDEF) domain-containing protein [Burkholderiales bacterium JOSHI_001]
MTPASSTPAAANDPALAPSLFKRLHQALMPDYNRRATLYWWGMLALGLLALVWAAWQLIGLPRDALLQVAAGTALAMLAGFFPVRVPQTKNSFVAGEIFIYLVLLLHGPAAAVMASTGEAIVGTWRTSRRWTSRIISPAMAAVSMLASGTLLQALLAGLKGLGLDGSVGLITSVMAFSVAYFLVNTTLALWLGSFKRAVWLKAEEVFLGFGWAGISCAASALLSVLLFLAFKESGGGVLAAAVPAICLVMTTIHFYFRQQEAAETLRRGRMESAEREAEQTARHMRELRDSEQRFHSAFTHASIGMALVDFSGHVRQVNKSLLTLLGRDEAGMLAHDFSDFVSAADAGSLAEQLTRIREGEVGSFTLELRCRHRVGREIWAALHGSVFTEGGSDEPSLILQAQDITARRQAEARLQHIAYHDSLTGLPNRSQFHQLLSEAVEHAQADRRFHFAVLFLDFDRFKLINDSMGHSAGDEFLVQVSRRIHDHVRPGDSVARLGGDEFAVLLNHLQDESHAVQLAERLQTALGVPLLVAGTELSTSASIGITTSSFGDRSPEELLRDADLAMYKAKAMGKARHAVFDTSLHAQASDRLHLESELRRALEAGQLSVAYQPLFNIASGALTGFEALARWQHPQRGEISPAVFIPVAEDSGLISRLSDYMLHEACHQLKAWQQRGDDWAQLRMQINISGHDVAHRHFGQRVRAALTASGISPAHLTLELTENILMERLEGASASLEALRQLGVSVSVDDFGTGYSSLSYLSTLPIDSLKIDRSFVHRLLDGSKESEIVRAVVSLGQSLGKSVIAEGIETPGQLNQLRAMGCEMGQGYHLARPQAADRIEALLDQLAAAPERPVRHSRPMRLQVVG